MRDTIDYYQSLVTHALRETVKTPSLLFIALLVASINTGSVFFHLYQFAVLLGPLNQIDFSIISALPTFAWLGFSNIAEHNFVMIAISVIGSIVLFFFGITAQQYLINRAHDRTILPKHTSYNPFTFQKPWLHLAFVNIIYILGLFVFMIFGGYILTSISTMTPVIHTVGTIGTYIILLIVAFYWNVITLLALMHVVREGLSAHHAIQSATTHVFMHPLRTLELSCVQLIIEGVFVLFGISILVIAGIFATLLITILSVFGSAFLLQAGFIFIGCAIGLSLLLFSAFITSFGYHLWAQYHKTSHALHIKPTILHLVNDIKHFIKT